MSTYMLVCYTSVMPLMGVLMTHYTYKQLSFT